MTYFCASYSFPPCCITDIDLTRIIVLSYYSNAKFARELDIQAFQRPTQETNNCPTNQGIIIRDTTLVPGRLRQIWTYFNALGLWHPKKDKKIGGANGLGL